MMRDGSLPWAESRSFLIRRGGIPLAFFGMLIGLSAAVLFLTYTASSLAAEGCANEARRAEQVSTYLPDCRAYELVTPPDKDSAEPTAVEPGFLETDRDGLEGERVAMDGNRIAWSSEYVLPGSEAPGINYLSTRSEAGWSSKNVVPRQSVENGLLCPNLVLMVAYSQDLAAGVLADGFGQATQAGGYLGEGLECGHDEPRLVPGEPEGYQNLFLKNNETENFQLVNVTPSGVTVPKPVPGESKQYYSPSYLGGSSDLKQIVFEDELQLTPEAPLGDDVYEWNAGTVRLVTILPDGSPVVGTLGGATRNTTLENETHTFIATNLADVRHAVSADGSRVFFQANGNLYERINSYQPQSPLGSQDECLDPGLACTIQIDESQAGGSGGGGEFVLASEDGTRVFFMDADSTELTSDTVGGSGRNLYEYNLATSTLKDITPAPEADVLGVSGASEDGSYVYFVAIGALSARSVAGGTNQVPTAGQPNLYQFHSGVLTFIATLDPSRDACDWTANTGCSNGAVPGESGLTARTSETGEYMEFESVAPLTGFDNTDLNTGEPDEEIFLYESAGNRLVCASCDPSGVRPSAPALIRYPTIAGGLSRNAYPQRNVSNDGQVFFETSDGLVLTDTNGQRDVYEFEGGHLSLISSGTSEAGSFFVDATPTGDNVFFATAQKLLTSDTDSVYDYYDARINGGFVEPFNPNEECAGEGCRTTSGVGAPPALLTPGSLSFVGSVEAKPASKTVVKKSKKAKRKKRRRKKGKRHSLKKKKGKKAASGKRSAQSRGRSAK